MTLSRWGQFRTADRTSPSEAEHFLSLIITAWTGTATRQPRIRWSGVRAPGPYRQKHTHLLACMDSILAMTNVAVECLNPAGAGTT
jgi:hypothetical protein